MDGERCRVATHKAVNSILYKSDTHIEKSHIELGILIEQLLEERNAWRHTAWKAIAVGARQCNHAYEDCSAHPDCLWCRAVLEYENTADKYGLD